MSAVYLFCRAFVMRSMVAMMALCSLSVLSLFVLPLCAAPIDPSQRSFDNHVPKKMRVDRYDFAENYPSLEKIEIDALRKKNVELILTGDYPVLEKIQYDGSFGHLVGTFTGHFPELSEVNVICTNCAMELDFSGAWQRSCAITICGQEENVIVTLPRDVKIVVETRTGPSGKVVTHKDLKKQGFFSIWHKTYTNAHLDHLSSSLEGVETNPVVLHFYIETTKGHIILNDS